MIAAGDRVTIHYTTRSLEGCVLETTRRREPLSFIAGSDDVIRGVSEGVIGLCPGDVRSLAVPPEQAFGNPQSELLQIVPRTLLPAGIARGDQLSLTLSGVRHDVWIRRLMDATVELDANHPLAGEPLLVDVEVIAAEPARPDSLAGPSTTSVTT